MAKRIAISHTCARTLEIKYWFYVECHNVAGPDCLHTTCLASFGGIPEIETREIKINALLNLISVNSVGKISRRDHIGWNFGKLTKFLSPPTQEILLFPKSPIYALQVDIIGKFLHFFLVHLVLASEKRFMNRSRHTHTTCAHWVVNSGENI